MDRDLAQPMETRERLVPLDTFLKLQVAVVANTAFINWDRAELVVKEAAATKIYKERRANRETMNQGFRGGAAALRVLQVVVVVPV